MEIATKWLQHLFPFFLLLPASGQGSAGHAAGGSQVWDESGHQPQAQRDLYAGRVQQHQPSGAAHGVGQSQLAAHLAAWHEGEGALGGIYMFIELQGCIIRKHIDVAQMFIHHTIFMNMTLNIGQAFFLYCTCDI